MFMPRNLFGAFVGNQRNVPGDVLPLIAFAIVVGAAGLGLPRERRHKVQQALETVSDLMSNVGSDLVTTAVVDARQHSAPAS
jgi:DAACS family dicarboxylate/amino acid:cation (Na+ or H+) symporter